MLDANSRALRLLLAMLCLIAPLFFGVAAMEFLTTKIIGFEVKKIQWTPPILEAKANPAAASGGAESPSAGDLTMLPLTRQLVGRENFASVSGLHLVSCAAALGIALYVLGRRVKRLDLLAGLIIVAFAATSVTYLKNPGQEDIQEQFVHAVLRAADSKIPVFACPAAQAASGQNCTSAFGQSNPSALFTSNGLLWVVHANTLIGIFVAFLALFALVAVSLPAKNSSSAELHESASQLRLLLFSTSAVFVTSNLASKAYLEIPTTLLAPPTDTSFRQLLGALLSSWSTIYTIILITAFGPAFAAWMLERRRYREAVAENSAAAAPKTETASTTEARQSHSSMGSKGVPTAKTSRKEAAENDVDEEDDSLNILPWSTLTSLLSIIAPLIASPMLEAVGKLLGLISGKG